jgi:hypothetical protein
VAGSEIQPYREARRGWVWPARRSSPTGRRAEGGVAGSEIGALPGGAPRLGVAGSEIQPYREARRGWVWPARRSSPTLGTLREVGMDREDSILTGRWAA